MTSRSGSSSASLASSGPAATSAVVLAVLVAALGYFVDIYDLVLFTIVRVPSLTDLGLNETAVQSEGLFLLNVQMTGMLIGGVLWGILGDRRGRLSVLFGSIALYSVANILNGMVQNVDQYAVLRLMAGIGLAGELGAGITLVGELMHRERRGYGTMIVATVGILGAVAAALIAREFDWRTAYYIGGGLGIGLLVLRVSVAESGMFTAVRESDVSRGSLRLLFATRERGLRYLKCVLVGAPTWFIVGILVAFSNDFGRALGVGTTKETLPNPGFAIMYCYIGLAVGDFTSGLLSQLFKTRRKVALGFVLLSAASVAVYLLASGITLGGFYLLIGIIGFGAGFWAIFVTIASEQFGTNLRATVATTVPNMARGALVPLSILFTTLTKDLGILGSAAIVGVITYTLSITAILRLDETFGRDLDFVESDAAV